MTEGRNRRDFTDEERELIDRVERRVCELRSLLGLPAPASPMDAVLFAAEAWERMMSDDAEFERLKRYHKP